MGKYLDNRLKYHTASRVGAQTGYSLAQALDPDGHIIRNTSVWTAATEAFPMNTSSTTDPTAATENLISVFAGEIDDTGEPSAEGATLDRTLITDDGSVYGYVIRNTNYPAVELFYKAEMSGVNLSNGTESGGTYQAYEVKEDNKRVMRWVAPTAVLNSSNVPQAGYSGIAEAYKDSAWGVLQDAHANWKLANGNWEFIYVAGILTFDPSSTPGKLSYSKVRFTGFRYIGETLDKKLDNINMVWEED